MYTHSILKKIHLHIHVHAHCMYMCVQAEAHATKMYMPNNAILTYSSHSPVVLPLVYMSTLSGMLRISLGHDIVDVIHVDPKTSIVVSHILVGCVSLHSYTTHSRGGSFPAQPLLCCAVHCNKAREGYSGLTTEQPHTVTCEGMVAQVNSGWIMKRKNEYRQRKMNPI